MTPTSEIPRPDRVYVWTWLPGRSDPVPAGVARQRGDLVTFAYGQSYLARDDAISLYGPELPMAPGRIEPVNGLSMAGCLRDGAPDAWGRRVIESRLRTGENLELRGTFLARIAIGHAWSLEHSSARAVPHPVSTCSRR